MRCAIYARYSTDRQSARSIDDQIALCEAFVADKGGTVSEVYADYALSGGTSHRPGFEKLVDDIPRDTFDAIVAEAMDRLSRDQADIALLHRKCRYHGIGILTTAEGAVEELHIGLKGTMNALYLKDLADKTRRGLRGRVDAGLAAGGRSYGYDVVRKLGPNGEPQKGQRCINADEARIVRRIFDEYNRGKSPRSIARDLNAEDIPAPRGGQWSASTINGNKARRNGILHNELYIGVLVWNRQSFRKNPDTGRRTARINPRSDWKVVEVPDLRIISDEAWDKAQARTAGQKPKLHETRRARRLLSGLIRCGSCGGSYTVTTRNFMQCFNYREKGSCTNKRMVAIDDVERRVLNGLRDNLLTPELIQAFAREYEDHVRRLRHATISRQTQLEKELRALTKEVDHVVDAIAAAGISEALKERLLAAESRQKQVKAELASLDDTPVYALHPKLPEIFKRRVAQLQDALNADGDTRREAAEILRQLIDRIVVEPQDSGPPAIRLEGHLAHILSLAHTREGEAVTVKVVAGAGFEPATFRL